MTKRHRSSGIPAELARQVYFRPGNPGGGVGRCWHCGRELRWDPVAAAATDAPRREWHVDHWPVALRDIRGQVLLGVTDPHLLSNLVPSCVNCNTSHRHEIRRWHGRTQLRCTALGVVVSALCSLAALALCVTR